MNLAQSHNQGLTAISEYNIYTFVFQRNQFVVDGLFRRMHLAFEIPTIARAFDQRATPPADRQVTPHQKLRARPMLKSLSTKLEESSMLVETTTIFYCPQSYANATNTAWH